MRAISINQKTLLIHVLVWLGFAVYEQSVLLITGPSQFALLPFALNYLLNAGLFYTNSGALLSRLYDYEQQRYLPYTLAVLALLAVYALLRSELNLHWLPALNVPPPATSYEQFWLLASYRGTFFLFASTGYWFARTTVALEKQRREQEQQLRAAETGLIQANLDFLKSQINPHFLFNSLNFLYAQVYPHSESAAKGILLLSDTMRYALHEDNNGKVMLTQEVQHVHNYIAINQLRFNNELQVNFEIEGNIHFLMILPLVLITFVENCFKHGELADPANPLTIRLRVIHQHLTFHTGNKKRHGPKEKSTGIGLANTKKRLDIVYKDRYSLTVSDEPNWYTCDLTIEL